MATSGFPQGEIYILNFSWKFNI